MALAEVFKHLHHDVITIWEASLRTARGTGLPLDQGSGYKRLHPVPGHRNPTAGAP
jgi:hypothetical protein